MVGFSKLAYDNDTLEFWTRSSGMRIIVYPQKSSFLFDDLDVDAKKYWDNRERNENIKQRQNPKRPSRC